MGFFLGGVGGGGVSVLLKRDWVNSIHYQFRHRRNDLKKTLVPFFEVVKQPIQLIFYQYWFT